MYALRNYYLPTISEERKMKLEMYLDRGNGGSKVLSILNEKLLSPFKIPSVTRRVGELEQTIRFGPSGPSFLCGNAAIESYDGIRYTPLDENNKIKDLSVVVAAAIAEVVGDGGPVELSLAVSSPLFYQGIEKDIEKELSRLDVGFRKGESQYTVLLERVGAFQEGVIFLELNTQFDGVIDLGQGTLLAGIRHPHRGVVTLPLSDGNLGGCNLIMSALLEDEKFLKAVKAAGFSSAPSSDKLSSLLSNGRWEVKGIDFRKYLKPHLAIAKQRLENAAQSIKAELQNASPYETVVPRIAFIGGGSSLMQGILGDALGKWCDKHHLVMYTDSPDYQTVLQMYAAVKRDPKRLTAVRAESEVAA